MHQPHLRQRYILQGKFSFSAFVLLALWPGKTQQVVAAPSLDDLVVAFPVDMPHLPLAIASRAWRKGVRTVIANNFHPTEAMIEEGKLHNETWVYYPDDNPLRSMYGGDSRAALMPFIAHKELGDTYKWLLYGDDDTIFFLDTVLRLLEQFDHDIPYFITDHFWWPSVPNHPTHPNHEAPRCLPCHHQPPADTTHAPLDAPIGCPCTPQVLCAKDPDHRIYNKWCDVPRAPAQTYSMHGGAGSLLSVALLRNISWDWMEECVTRSYSTGGDAFVSICLWQAGFAMTDPGVMFYRPEVQMFDPGPEDRMGVMLRFAHAFESKCDDDCWVQLDNMVTLHVRSRMFPTLDDAAFFIKGVSTMFDSFVELRQTRQAAMNGEALIQPGALRATDAAAAAMQAGAADAQAVPATPQQ